VSTEQREDLEAIPLATGFLVCAAVGLLALIIVLAAIRVTHQDLSGVDPLAAPAR